MIDNPQKYYGYLNVALSDEELAQFYEGNCDYSGFLENEYLLLENEKGEVIDKYKFSNGSFTPIKFSAIQNSYEKNIKPRNIYQTLAFDLLSDRDTKVKLIRGVFGSGKDYIMINKALQLIEQGRFDKIVFIRPNVTVGDVPEIGYLKGDIADKLGWTLGPLYDKVGGEEGVKYMMADGQLELVPLLFIRGRSFEKSIIYVTEGQNITSEIAKLIISRIGEESELWINADNHQTDRKIYEQDNGIKKMIERLSGNKLFGYVYLPKTERSEVANLANLLDD